MKVETGNIIYNTIVVLFFGGIFTLCLWAYFHYDFDEIERQQQCGCQENIKY